ncbi:MAG TPA: SH3 domain-containing protein [Steroidobacteraceae bacterium]|jgi:hypothetical protein
MGAVALLASAALLPGIALADPMFVSDQLVVNVSSEASGGERVATIKSGDKVELLERQGDAAQVQLANGSQGWVKASYLVSEAPAQRRLQDRIAEIDKLHKDISRLESELTAARVAATPATGPGAGPAAQAAGSGTPGGLRTAAGVTANAAKDAGAEPGNTGPGVAAGAQPSSEDRDSTGLMGLAAAGSRWPTSAWGWLLGCAAAALILGFTLGWKTLDRRIREKYGGLRIY